MMREKIHHKNYYKKIKIKNKNNRTHIVHKSVVSQTSREVILTAQRSPPPEAKKKNYRRWTRQSFYRQQKRTQRPEYAKKKGSKWIFLN